MATIHSISLLSFVYIAVIAILYFTKKKEITRDNIYFSILLMLALILVPLEIMNTVTLSTSSSMPHIIHKLYDVVMAIWSSIFFLYGVHQVDEEKKEESMNKTMLILKVSYLVAFFIGLSIILFILPSNIKETNGILYETGLRVHYIVFMTAFYQIFIDINLFMNKVKDYKKLAPIITFQVMFLIGSILRYFVTCPGYIVVNIITSIVILIMVNTIENPDLKMKNELDVAKRETEKATRAKSDFLSSMSHEIRTPLNAIVGLSQLISEEPDINDNIKSDLNDIQLASTSLLEILSNILDINKIESGEMDIQNMNYVVQDMIDELVRVNKVRIGTKKINVETVVSSDVPYELVGDKIHVKQIVNNLLSNAIKYTEEGTVTLKVDSKNDGFVSLISFTVSDTGKGIKTEDQNKLFTKFERLNSADSSTMGSGLGLAITKQLVELLNGTIKVSSVVGKGTEFVVTIPQSISMMMNPKQIALEYKIEQMENEDIVIDVKKKVLLVDDSAINLRIASSFLRGQNLTVETCTSGKDAIELAKRKQYDIIFCDLKMPNMDGFKTLDVLKTIKDFNAPVVAFTAVEEDVEALCLNAGFASLLTKPFTKEQLLGKINTLLGTYYTLDSATESKDNVSEGKVEIPPEELPTAIVPGAPLVNIPVPVSSDAPAVVDTPVVATPVVSETPVVAEKPIVEATPVTEEIPVDEEDPVVETVAVDAAIPAMESTQKTEEKVAEEPVIKEESAVVTAQEEIPKEPSVEESIPEGETPAIDLTPAVTEEASSGEEPVVEVTQVSEEIPVVEETPIVESPAVEIPKTEETSTDSTDSSSSSNGAIQPAIVFNK